MTKQIFRPKSIKNLLILTPTTTSIPIPTPASILSPTSTQAPTLQELVRYMLDLINKDRREAGLSHVTLGNNTAAQKHAKEMADNAYISHWGLDGLKPYMRYTLAGGYNYEAENTHLSLYGYTVWTRNGIPFAREINKKDPREDIFQAEKNWMESPGHKRNILNKWHKKINLGLAWGEKGFAAIQQFEGDYVEFNDLPAIMPGGIFSAQGKTKIGQVFSIVFYYDSLSQQLTPKQLNEGPRSYSLGEEAGSILPQLPPGQYYTNLKPNDIVARRAYFRTDGPFAVETDVAPILRRAKEYIRWLSGPKLKMNPFLYRIFLFSFVSNPFTN